MKKIIITFISLIIGILSRAQQVNEHYYFKNLSSQNGLSQNTVSAISVSYTHLSGAGATPRGYKFSYDRLGRLTDAEYGEGPSLSVSWEIIRLSTSKN